ncbi:MAG: ACT domain-containing protein [Cellulomonas sp.]
MAAVQDLTEMLGQMRPDRRPGSFVFVTVAGPPAPTLHPVMTFAEDEGRTLILTTDEADDARLPYGLVLAWITLTVHSALDGVGLTAAVSSALADAGISCNMVAAAFHDHLFVPLGSADDAVRVLTELSARHRPGTRSETSDAVPEAGAGRAAPE